MANTSNYVEQGGARDVVGGSLDVISGGDLDVESGGALKIGGTAVSATAAELNKIDGAAATTAELDQRVITGEVTLGAAGQTYVCSPFTGNVVAIRSVVEGGTDTTAETLTVKDNGGNTIGTLTIANGASAGEVDASSDIDTDHDDVAAGDMIEIETDGANGQSVAGNVFVTIQIT